MAQAITNQLERQMNNQIIHSVGTVAEYFDTKVVVTSVDKDKRTFDLSYYISDMPFQPDGFKNRPFSELVRLPGTDRIIWNHE
jgi:hypothetical protein